MAEHDDHDHDHGHTSDHGHVHEHGHHHDKGLAGFLRYLRFLPSMWRSEVNNTVVSRLAPGNDDIIVDIGAGMGSGVVPATSTGAQVIAVEPTNYMRAILNGRMLVGRRRKQIRVVDGVAEKLGLADASVTMAMAVNAVHHWSNIEVAASELARVLKPGGQVLLVDEQFRDPTHPDYDRHEEKHDQKFDEADLDRTVRALEDAGLSDVVGKRETLAEVPVLSFTAKKV